MAGSHGFNDAASDPEGIRNLWPQYRSANGVGISTGAPSGVWGLDVDVKDGHQGDETLHDLEREHGELPVTVEVLTPTGGTHLYFKYDSRVHSSAGMIGDGLDVRSDGGYLVAPGSRYTDEREYMLDAEHHPSVVGVATAPEWLIDLVAASSPDRATILKPGELSGMIDRMKDDGWTEMTTSYGRRRFARPPLKGEENPPGPDNERASLYPPDEGWPEGRLTIFTTSLPKDHWLKPGTYGPRVDLGKELMDRVEARVGGSPPLPDAGERSEYPSIPDEVWDARPLFAQIRQAAHSRQRSAPAVLATVLSRAAAMVDHRLMLPPIVGGEKPLCFFSTILAPPAGGKTDANAVGSELLPFGLLSSIAVLPAGSGEGMIECLFEMVKVDDGTGKKVSRKTQTKHNAYVYIDEGEIVRAIEARQGSSLMSNLRSIWSGGIAGQANANTERNRPLPAGSYTYGLVMGLQESKGGPLLADAGGGTPQRFFWALATDPTIPDTPVPWPGSLDWMPPTLGPQSGTVHLTVADPVAAEIRHADLLRAQGKVVLDELDGHGMLVRLKIAALLGLLDNRWSVSEEDWYLAGRLRAYSDSVRQRVQSVVQAHDARKEQSSTARAARAQIAVESAKEQHLAQQIETLANKVKDKFVVQPGITVREVSKALTITGEKAQLVLDYAMNEGWIEERNEAGQGTAKRLLYPPRTLHVVE
jgi:hypothetical protein